MPFAAPVTKATLPTKFPFSFGNICSYSVDKFDPKSPD
jgi:hypothetical protein